MITSPSELVTLPNPHVPHTEPDAQGEAVVSVGGNPKFVAHYVPMDIEQLREAIPRFTPKQQAVLSLLPITGGRLYTDICRRAGCSPVTLRNWLRGDKRYKSAHYSIIAASRALMPELAISGAKAASLAAMHRDINLATADNLDDPRRLALQLRSRETLYKVAGVLRESGGSPQINVAMVLHQVAQERRDQGNRARMWE